MIRAARVKTHRTATNRIRWMVSPAMLFSTKITFRSHHHLLAIENSHHRAKGKIRILSTTLNNPLECFQFCWETEKKFVSQSVAPIREDLSTNCYYRRGFLPFLLPATSVTPRARPQELVSSERELARHARGIRVATLA